MYSVCFVCRANGREKKEDNLNEKCKLFLFSVHAFVAPKSPNYSAVNIMFAIISILVAQSGIRGRMRLIWSLPPL
jgi:hypothetical protein